MIQTNTGIEKSSTIENQNRNWQCHSLQPEQCSHKNQTPISEIIIMQREGYQSIVPSIHLYPELLVSQLQKDTNAKKHF